MDSYAERVAACTMQARRGLRLDGVASSLRSAECAHLDAWDVCLGPLKQCHGQRTSAQEIRTSGSVKQHVWLATRSMGNEVRLGWLAVGAALSAPTAPLQVLPGRWLLMGRWHALVSRLR